MKIIKTINDITVGDKFNNKRNGKDFTAEAINAKEDKVTFVDEKGIKKDNSFKTIKRWLVLISEGKTQTETKTETKQEIKVESVVAEVEQEVEEVAVAVKEIVKEVKEMKKEVSKALEVKVSPKVDKKDKVKKTNTSTIEFHSLELLKQGGTVKELSDKLETVLTEKAIKFTDCKMRIRRSIYYAEAQNPGYIMSRDKTGGRGNTVYKLVLKTK